MFRTVTLCFVIGMVLAGCQSEKNKSQEIDSLMSPAAAPEASAETAKSETSAEQAEDLTLPTTATKADERGDLQLFLNEEQPADENNLVDVTSVWLKNKQTGKVRRLFVTNPDAELQWERMTDGAVEVPIGQIAAAEKALFVPGHDHLILVEGCPDARNIWTYTVDIDQMNAKQFPSTEGLISFEDNGQRVHLGSYNYDTEKGRYSIEETYTIDGKKISSKKIDEE